MKKATIGFAMCGSFCTFSKAFEQMQKLKDSGFDIIPIMSANAFTTDTRFGKAEDMIKTAEKISGKKVLKTIADTEPIGPKNMCDLLVIAPCTGNTLSKLSNGITDTSVTMAAKSHLRVLKPLLICAATNDALGASAQNIGRLLNTKNIYFVPLKQDNPVKKPNSLVADFGKLEQSVISALGGKQIQPIIG
ncbi:MAG TPA: dipicolinate synthase subunit B [Ruminococcaceae bacterium]|nr:dipicolinate synthase subunit B [Oscillospiraceae bacterium]